MGLPLPYGCLRFLQSEEAAAIIDEFMRHRGVHLDPNTDEYGYFIQCDLRYPDHLMDYFASFPPLPERKKVLCEELSPHTRQLGKTYGIKSNRPTTKLISDLRPKHKYTLHYAFLKHVLFLGVELIKIHRVVQFKQKAWLKPYIEANTLMRSKATSESERNFWKLMNVRNAFYFTSIFFSYQYLIRSLSLFFFLELHLREDHRKR